MIIGSSGERVRIALEKSLYTDTVDLYLYTENTNGTISVAMPTEFVFTPIDETTLAQPTMRFRRGRGDEFLKSLSGALIRMGYQADELEVNAKQVDAIKYHLEDMRKLVFRDET